MDCNHRVGPYCELDTERCVEGSCATRGEPPMKCQKCGCTGNSACGKSLQDCSLNEIGICPCCARWDREMVLLRAGARATYEATQSNFNRVIHDRDALAALVAALRDCRICDHFTLASGGCLSPVRCVNGQQLTVSKSRVKRYWEVEPCE